jgi:UDP:flavonoid glycosyltransferase YjiC (YdhE family)
MEVGAGAKPLPQKSLTSENLAAALKAVMGPAMIARAKEIGVSMRAEGGANAAAKVIDRVINRATSETREDAAPLVNE